MATEVHRMTVRLSEPSKEHVERAAALEGVTPSTWVAQVAAQAAARRLAEHNQAHPVELDDEERAWWALTMPAAAAVRDTFNDKENG